MSKKALIAIAAVLVVIAGISAAFAFSALPPAQPSENAVKFDNNNANKGNENSSASSSAADDLPENPIDFDAKSAEYPHMYAWIRISGTDIDFPVVQHPTDDFYYLDHNAYGEEDNNGAIYTQMCNSTDFQDPVTVIYGHDMNLSGAMLNQLHLFEDKSFFDANEYFEIYMPGRIMRYRIISAYVADDRHIMNSFDFTNETTLRQYFDSVCHPVSIMANVREGAQLDPNDKIVQISTCMSNAALPNSRYLVTGELIETRLTK